MASSGKITIRDLTESAKAQKDCYFCAYLPSFPRHGPTNYVYVQEGHTKKRVKPAFDSNMKIDFHQ